MSRVLAELVMNSPGLPGRRHHPRPGAGIMRARWIMQFAAPASGVRARAAEPGQELTDVGQAIGMTGNRRAGERPGMVAIIRRAPDPGPGQKLTGVGQGIDVAGNRRVGRPGMVAIVRRVPDSGRGQRLTGGAQWASIAGNRRAGQGLATPATLRRMLDTIRAVFQIMPPCRDRCGVNT